MTTSIESLEKENVLEEVAIHDLLRKRRSTRAFQARPVEREKLRRLFEAARWAPSSSNEQPWRFIVATQEHPEDFAALLGTLAEGNRVWAQYAPVLVISVTKKLKGDGRDNRHAFYDVGQAVTSLILQAVEEGLLARQMGGFSPDKAREVLNIPEGYEAVSVIALGYPGDPANLPEDVRAKESAARTRKPLSEIVFGGAWERSWQ